MCYRKSSQKSIQNPVKHLRWIFHKKFYLTCFKGSSYASESLKYIFKIRSGITVKISTFPLQHSSQTFSDSCFWSSTDLQTFQSMEKRILFMAANKCCTQLLMHIR